MSDFPIPLIGLCAYSGTGKTTLLTLLIPLLLKKNVRIGVVKHAHHSFEIDWEGKDSYRFRQSGAEQIVVASRKRIALIKETKNKLDEPVLSEALSVLDTNNLDLVIVEGFKDEAIPKIELHRPSLGTPLICTHDRNIIALASDEPVPVTVAVPQLNLNQVNVIADFILSYIDNHHNKTPVHALQAR